MERPTRRQRPRLRRDFSGLITLGALALLCACTANEPSPARVPATSSTTVVPPASATTARPPDTTTAPSVVPVRYRVERRTADDATADFVAAVNATLTDPRGWTRARFAFVEDPNAPYAIILAEGPEVDRLCLPYETYGQYSCQNGPVVAINADRWRSATTKWTGDLATYRQMLVNHEVGHLLGQRHPRPQCAEPGRPAPIMNQQSTELDGCLPNPWPLEWEAELAARHDRALAPPPD